MYSKKEEELSLTTLASLIIYLKFYTEQPPRRASISGSNDSISSSLMDSDTAEDAKILPRASKILAATCLAYTLLVLTPSISVVSSSSAREAVHHMVLDFWTLFVGGSSIILCAVQYLPQIYLTFKLKNTGSLSIASMCLQWPIFIILAVSLAFRITVVLDPAASAVVKFASNIAWLNYTLGGCVLCVLLGLSIYVNHIRPRMPGRTDGEGEASGTTTPPNEETPLIEGESADEARLSRAINKTISVCR